MIGSRQLGLDWNCTSLPALLQHTESGEEVEVCLHQVAMSQLLEVMLQRAPAFLDSWGLKLWEEAYISYFRLNFPVIILPPESLGQLFWTLLLWICLVSETHRIFTICIFTCGSWHYFWNLKPSQIHLVTYGDGPKFCKFCSSINARAGNCHLPSEINETRNLSIGSVSVCKNHTEG